jgi:hypothetical protein
VRQAAKDTLVELGPAVRDKLVPWLDHHDEFARNGCAEVLQNLGIVADLVAEADDHSNQARAAAAMALLRKILTAGGERIVDAATATAGVLDQTPFGAPAAKVRAA